MCKLPSEVASGDRLLQGRLFSYSDTQRYRLGVNYQYLPVNKAKSEINTFAQDGSYSTRVADDEHINYQPNSFDGSLNRDRGSMSENPEHKYSKKTLSGTTQQEMIKPM